MLFKIGVGKRRLFILVGNGKLALVGSGRDKSFYVVGHAAGASEPLDRGRGRWFIYLLLLFVLMLGAIRGKGF